MKNSFRRIIDLFIKYGSSYVLLSVMAFLFFIFYSFLAINSPEQYNSPDEQANYFFINLFAEKGTLFYEESLNSIALKMVHPRSMAVVGTSLVPGSFLGLILILGTLVKFFGRGVINFVVPFVSAVTPFFFYFLLKNIFRERVALLSSIILFLHPAFWYYASRPLFPNLLAVDFLVIGFSFLFYAYKKRSLRNLFIAFFGALFLGMALSIRLSEFFWIMFFLFILMIWAWRGLGWSKICSVVLGLLSGVFPTFYYNKILYGGFFRSGYFEVATTIEAANGVSETFLTFMKFIVSPFGFNLKYIIKNSIQYQLHVFDFLIPVFILSVFYFIISWRDLDYLQRRYFISGICVSIILLIYYGSWSFNDHPNPKAISIGTSYIRYWLPIYIFLIPIYAYAFDAFLSKIQNIFYESRFVTFYSGFFIFLIYFIFSASLVLWSTDESLVNVLKSIERGKNGASFVIERTEKESLVITDYDDKFLFPERRVSVPFRNDFLFNALPDIIPHVPVYYFGLTFSEKDFTYLNMKKLFERSLMIKEVESYENKTLYRIFLNQQPI